MALQSAGRYTYEVHDRFSMYVFAVYYDGDVKGSINIQKGEEHLIELWKQAIKTMNEQLKSAVN